MAGFSEISLLNFTQFADLTKRTFTKWPEMVSDLAEVQSLYKVEDIPANTGSTKNFIESDAQTYARIKGEGADAQKVQAGIGYNITMTMRRFAAEIDISWEARKTGKNQEIVRKMTDLAQFIPQRMALDLTHRLTFATATSYTDMDGETVTTTVGDGNQLVYATHTLASSAVTYSNVVTGNPQFSQGGFEVARAAENTQVYNNFGEQRVVFTDSNRVIVTGNDPSTVREVRQLLQSTSDPTQNNPGVVNVNKNMFTHVILTRLATTATGAYDSTKAKYWADIAKGVWEAHLGIWEQPNLKMPAAGNNGEDMHNDNWTFGTRGAYGIAILNGLGFLLSTGAGA